MDDRSIFQSVTANSSDYVIDLNDQNQVVVDEASPGEGYLWETGGTISVFGTCGVPSTLQGDVYNVQPFSISNQVSSGSDATIHILAKAQNREDENGSGSAPTEQFVWTRDNSGNWTYAKVQLPSGTSINDWTAINSSGVIAATGTAPGRNTNDALLLVPVQLKQTNYPTTAGEVDPGVSGTETISSGTTSNSVAYITGSAAMPMLQVEIANGSLSGMQVQWWMTVTSERPERGTQDNLQIPALEPGYVTIPINQPWEIDDYYPEPFGGICTIHYIIQDSSGNNLTPEQTFPFLIRGKNPTPTEAHNYIQAEPGGTTTYYYAWGVAKHESAQDTYNAIYCQFNAGGPTLALPNYGYANGWGIFQRDDTGGGIPVTTDQVYSWKVNSDVSVQQELPQKWNGANNYLNGLSTQYPTQYGQDPPPTYTTGNGTVFAAIDTLTMEAYNGAGTYSHLLTFYPSNAHGHRWAWHLPNAPKDTEPYVDRVAERMSTSP